MQKTRLNSVVDATFALCLKDLGKIERMNEVLDKLKIDAKIFEAVELFFRTAEELEHVNSAWELNVLQEMIIAYILLQRKWVRRVWLHKSLQQKKNGKYSERIRADLIVQTVDGKIVLIDVTTQNDLSNIVGDLKKSGRDYQNLA